MRNLLIFMAFVAVFVLGNRACNDFHFGFGGISGKGPIQTETRSASSFHGIDLEVGADVEVTVGDNYFVEISAQQNLLPVLKTSVENGALRIYCDDNIHSKEPIKIRVTAPAFDLLSIGGSGTIRVQNALLAEKMAFNIGGSGEVHCPQADFGKLSISISGNGEVELGGKANDLTIDIAGSGDVNAKALTTNTLKVSISGSGTVKADVTTDLDASISGSGDVLYSGSPHVNSSVSGSGTVKKIEVQ
jgi:hypothetical protein